VSRAPATASAFIAVLIAVSSSFVPTPVRAADPGDSNIPGVPLPGPVVTGTLGGPVYDRVYRLTVPAGNVVVASMTGSEGTDFDMYLFDSTATTVFADPPVGLVARSKGEGSTESISYPSRAGGTFYLDLNGATDVMGEFTLSVSILPDEVAPSVTVRIEGGVVAVNHPNVILTIVAIDELSGVDVMSLSTDGTSWQAWQPYTPTLAWTFPSGDGPKRIWVRVRDRAGNTSSPVAATIVVDTSPPTVVSVSPEAGAVVEDLRPTIRVAFSKQMVPVWWNTGGLTLRPVNGGDPVPGVFAYDDATRTGAYRPSIDLTTGTLYSVQLSTLYDIAHNSLVPYPAWTFTPKLPVDLRITVTPPTITSGASAVVIGTAALPSPAAVEIQQRPIGTEAWTTIGAPFPDRAGGLRVAVAPRTNVAYRLHVAESATGAESYSPVVPLLVRSRITLAGLVPSKTYPARVGATQTLNAQVAPARGRVAVTYQMYRWDPTKRVWRFFVKTTRMTNASGVATWTWKHRAGSWRLRVTCAATPDNEAGISGLYVWSVK